MTGGRTGTRDPDPVADIFDIKRFAIHDGPGIRTTVFFRGCPLACWWCHNPEARLPDCEVDYRSRALDSTLPPGDNVIGPAVRLRRIVDEISRDRVFYEQSGGGLTASGGEPLMQPAFLEALLRRCRENGISTAVDTSGYAPREVFEALDGLVDLYLFDLKIMDEDDHRTYTGVGNGLIHENLDVLLSAGTQVLARIPLIPGITETDENIDGLVSFLAARREIKGTCLLPYNRLGEDKVRRLGLQYRPGTMSTQTPQRLCEIAGRFEEAGLDVRIGG
jgi:pyruvate formate lyase activating enzyme